MTVTRGQKPNFFGQIGELYFPNPVLAASGTFGFGLEFLKIANRLGGVVTKSVTLEPKKGNPPPRIAEVQSGVVNSVGLENPGIANFKANILPKLRNLKSPLIVNLAGFSVDDFCRLVEELTEDKKVAAFELNLSCPNVQKGGALFGQNPKIVEKITAAVRKRTKKPLLIKLTANFVDPLKTARAAEEGGADAVVLLNTLFALVLDEKGRAFLGGRTGGLSGPAIKPFALFCVDRVAAKVKIPVIGCGGITSGSDAFEFLCAGASLVQVGSANLISPYATLRVWQELKALLFKKGVKSLNDIIGLTRRCL
ncbi:MAG: dihydroorotate dehydrogenase [candidate division WOR-3 bacterium]